MMFDWDTKLGACNREPNTDTPVHAPTHAQTHTDIAHTQTTAHTHIHAVTRTPHTPLRHLPGVLNVKVIKYKKRRYTASVSQGSQMLRHRIIAKQQSKERAWDNQQGKKTLLSLTHVQVCSCELNVNRNLMWTKMTCLRHFSLSVNRNCENVASRSFSSARCQEKSPQ